MLRMSQRILVVQGHPDPAGGHFLQALDAAYTAGAQAAGHEVRRVDVARLEFPMLRSAHDWNHGSVPATLEESQRCIVWATHLVFFFPLWMGEMPALLKGWLEQVARPGFAFEYGKDSPMWHKKLTGRSARVVVTMGMPALVYRAFYRAHSVKALERNILGFVGIGPIHESLIGNVEGPAAGRERWLKKLRDLGADGA
jgi:putative NADPH-quinone reductase